MASVRAQTVPVELVVVDNFSNDGTVAIAERFADRLLVLGPERSAQRNAGWHAAGGEAVAFVDSDMRLEPTVLEESLSLLDARPRLGAIVLPELAFGDGYFAACRALEKRLYLGDASVEAARVFRAAALAEVGGYEESLTGAEDWELPDRLVAAHWELGRTQFKVWHDEGRVRIGQQYAKKRYYGRGIRRYQKRTPPGRRRAVTRRSLLNPVALAHDPLHAAGLIVLKLVETAGIATGMAEEARATRSRQLT